MNTISGENDQAPSVSGMRELFERWLISVGQDERQASRDYSAHDLFVAGALAMLTAEQREAFKAEQQRVNFWASYRRIRAIRSQYHTTNLRKLVCVKILDLAERSLPTPDDLSGRRRSTAIFDDFLNSDVRLDMKTQIDQHLPKLVNNPLPKQTREDLLSNTKHLNNVLPHVKHRGSK